MGITTIKSTVSLEVETSLHILPLYAFGQEIQTAVALNIMLVPLFYPHCNPSGNKQKMSVRTDDSRGGLMRHPAGCVDFGWHTCHGRLQLQFKNEEASATWGHMVTWWWVHARTHKHRRIVLNGCPSQLFKHFVWGIVDVNELSGNMQTEVYLSIYRFRISCTVFNCRQRWQKKVESECGAHSFFSSGIHKNNITLIPMAWCNYLRLQFIFSYTCSECIRHNSLDHFTIPL